MSTTILDLQAAHHALARVAAPRGIAVLEVAAWDFGRLVGVVLWNIWGRMEVCISLREPGDWRINLLRCHRAACAAMHRKATFDGYSAGEAYEESLGL